MRSQDFLSKTKWPRFGLVILLVILAGVLAASQKVGGLMMPEAEVHELLAQTSEVTLYVRVAGELKPGNVLIAINGGPGMSSSYMLDLELLAGPRLAVVTYDQRGMGRSTLPSLEVANFSLDLYAADLEAVRQALGVDRVYLLGHSWGGLVAMYYAFLYPERVRGLVLVGSGPPTWQGLIAGFSRISARIEQLEREGLIPTDLPPDSPKRQEANLRAYFSDPGFWFPVDSRGTAPEFKMMVNQLTWAAVQGYDLTREVARLDHRVLILWGMDDPGGLPMAEETRQALKQARVEYVLLEKCGHFWHECPEQFYSKVSEFLGE